MRAHTHTYAHTYTHTHTRTHTHTQTHTHTRTRVRAHARAHTHTHPRAHRHTCMWCRNQETVIQPHRGLPHMCLRRATQVKRSKWSDLAYVSRFRNSSEQMRSGMNRSLLLKPSSRKSAGYCFTSHQFFQTALNHGCPRLHTCVSKPQSICLQHTHTHARMCISETVVRLD